MVVGVASRRGGGGVASWKRRGLMVTDRVQAIVGLESVARGRTELVEVVWVVSWEAVSVAWKEARGGFETERGVAIQEV